MLRELRGKNLPPNTGNDVHRGVSRKDSLQQRRAAPAGKEDSHELFSRHGDQEFVRLVKRFQTADHFQDVLKLAQSKPSEQVGVEAITALLELQAMGHAWQGTDRRGYRRCDRHCRSHGQLSERCDQWAAAGGCEECRAVNIDVRRAAVKAASRVNNGAEELVKLVDEKTLDPELEQSVAAALHSAPSREARAAGSAVVPAASVKGQHADAAHQRTDEAGGESAQRTDGVLLNRHLSQVPRR